MFVSIIHIVSKTVHWFLGLLSLKKIILFESNPDFACNTYPVFLEMQKQERFAKYKLIWMTHADNKIETANFFLEKSKSKFIMFKKWYLFERAKCFVSCNGLMTKRFPDQVSVFLSHGSKTKKTRGICEIGDGADYVMVQSHFFDEIIKYEYNLKDEQLVYCGYPRCDYLFSNDTSAKKVFDIPDDSKLFVWLPTFRKNKNSAKTDADSAYNRIGMPVVYSIDDLILLNNELKKNNAYIVFKPHPAQDISGLKATDLTNILIIDDDILFNKNIQLYQLLAVSDALITDYSSVYFDYLLLDRPIATTNDDANEWKNGRGFAFDLEAMYDKSTVRVGTFAELISFIRFTVNGKDEKKAEREAICNTTNLYQDGNSARRVVDFIAEKLGM